jgi:hypothetical protein
MAMVRNHLSNNRLTEGKMKSHAPMRLAIFSRAGAKQKPRIKQLVTGKARDNRDRGCIFVANLKGTTRSFQRHVRQC